MKSKWIISAICCLIALSGCRKSETGTATPSATQAGTPAAPTATPSAPPGETKQSTTMDVAGTTEVRPKIDACALLTSDEIESVQGEPVKETKLSGASSGGFNVSQCFFTLPTFTNSVSLSVTHRGEGGSARDPKKFWSDTFGGKRERDKKEEDEESGPPLKVSGVGDQAFWMGSRIGGALYVLRGNSYVRISVGGPADPSNKIRRSKTLVQKILPRL